MEVFKQIKSFKHYPKDPLYRHCIIIEGGSLYFACHGKAHYALGKTTVSEE